MKLPALVFSVSVALNAALLLAFAVKPALAPPSLRGFFTHRPPTEEVAAHAREAALRTEALEARNAAQAVAAREKLWSTLHSDDLKTLIARLRAAGFSPTMVRAIVNAEIQSQFAPRMKALVAPVVDAPFWKSEQSNMYGSKFFEQLNQLSRERAKVLGEALGDEFFEGSSDSETAERRRQFGNLPFAKIEAVQRISDDYAEMTSQVRTASQGIMLPEDRAKLALLEEEKRADLAEILSPAELADYQMRTSTVTMRLRSALTLMDATEDEFRTIYAVQQPFAETLFPTGPGFDAAKRNDALTRMADQLKTALGAQRYGDFARASNSEFQQLSRMAEREGIAKDATVRAFSLRDTVSAESNRIYDDPALNSDQKRAALQSLAQTTKTQLVSTLGVTSANAYIQSARWFSAVENGGAVSFGPDGNSTRIRAVAPARK